MICGFGIGFLCRLVVAGFLQGVSLDFRLRLGVAGLWILAFWVEFGLGSFAMVGCGGVLWVWRCGVLLAFCWLGVMV